MPPNQWGELTQQVLVSVCLQISPTVPLEVLQFTSLLEQLVQWRIRNSTSLYIVSGQHYLHIDVYHIKLSLFSNLHLCI